MIEQEVKLFDSEHRLAEIVWDREPVGSGELARLCKEQLGWQRTTTYTVLKKLCERGVLRNESATVTALVKREAIQHSESKRLLEKLFDNSLPGFIAAFMGESKITEEEADRLKRLIDSYRA